MHYLYRVAMTGMKRILPFAAALLLAAGVHAQGIERVVGALAAPDASGARVYVMPSPEAAEAVGAGDLFPRLAKVMVYRVSLSRDNSQTAGGNVRAVAAQFSELFPETGVEVNYKSPYFEAVAGNFIDRIDAVALCGKVAPRFPKAVVVQEEVPISRIIRQQNEESLPPEIKNVEK